MYIILCVVGKHNIVLIQTSKSLYCDWIDLR